jgi:hypothetical protein
VVSSLAPEHIVKLGNFGPRSGYQLIGKDRSDTFVDPSFMHWDSLKYSRLSLVLSLLMTLTRCCNGLMMCSIHIDESAMHGSKAAQPSCLYIVFVGKLDSLLDRLDNRHTMHGF